MKKGIYCLENFWYPSVKNNLTIKPILELLDLAGICKHIYHKCATREEVEFMLNKWKIPSIQKQYPILYFAFHGRVERLYINNKVSITLTVLGNLLENECSGKVFFFASCGTMDIHGKKVQSLLQKTGAIAAIGYKTEVDWMKATAFELLVLNALQDDKFDSKGIEFIKHKIETEYGKLHNDLDFRMVVNNNHFPRRRK